MAKQMTEDELLQSLDPKPAMSSEDALLQQLDPKPIASAPVTKPGPRNYAVSEVPGAAIRNSYGSAKNFAKGIRDTLIHPYDSASTLMDAAVGASLKVLPGTEQEMNDPRVKAAIDKANALGQVYVDRMGTPQRFINTMAEDPIGLAGDLSMFAGAGAGVARGALGAGSRTAKVLDTVATATNPMLPGGLAASVVSRPAGVASKAANLMKQKTAANALAAVEKYSNPATYANKLGEKMRHLATGPMANLVLNEAEDPIAILDQLKRNQQIVPGSQPNPGQAAAGVGKTRWSAMQGAVDKRMPTEAETLRASQAQAQLDHLRHIGHTPEIYEAHGRARARQSAHDYGISDPIMSTIDPQLVSLLTRPHSGDVVKQAAMLAGEKGHPFGSGNQLSGRDLHYLKLAFDTMAKKRKGDMGGVTDAVHDAIVGTRADFLKWVDKKNPAYTIGRENYAANSRVMDRMLFGQHLQQILEKQLTKTFTAEMKAEQFAKALTDPVNPVIKNHAVKRGTGNEYTIRADELMTPDEMKALYRIRDDLGRGEYVKGLGRNASAQHGNNLNTAASDWLLPNLVHQQGTASFLTRNMDERIAKQVSNAMQTQKGAAGLVEDAIRRKGAVDSAAKNINRLGRIAATPGAYNALRYFNNAEYQPPSLDNQPVDQNWSGHTTDPLEQSNNAFVNRKPAKKQQSKKPPGKKQYVEKPMP